MPITCSLEIKNVGGTKLRFRVLEDEIKKYNTQNDDFPIFRLDNTEGPLSSGEMKYIIGSFRPLTNKHYKVQIPIEYTDGNGEVDEDYIILSGHGYNPKVIQMPESESCYKNMPKSRIFNKFENNFIQKCGVSLEEIDFGIMENFSSSSQIIILYNYSLEDYFQFEFFNPGFNMDDVLEIEPTSGKLEPNSHIIIKIKLTPDAKLSNFSGELECRIFWLFQGDNKNITEKENIFIRIHKKAKLTEVLQ